MDLDFTAEQEMLREAVSGVCARYAGLDVVRQMENDPIGYPDKFWEQLAELGLLGMTVSEERGGSGMSMLDAAVVYTELGRALAPSPHFVSSVMSAGVIDRAGSAQQRDEWLPAISAGEVIFTTAWLEPGRGFGPEGVQLPATVDGDGWRLRGTKQHVPFARAADQLLVLARTAEGPTYFFVPPTADGVTLEQQLTISSDTQYRVDFDGVRVERDAVVGSPGDAWPVWDDTLHDGIILLAAQAVGGAQYAHAITTQYAKDRHQFDKPLGAFQALAHYMADASTRIDGGRVLARQAAWNRAQGRSVARLAPMAKLFCCETYRETTRVCAQIWGGVAFTIEYDQQMFFRRAKSYQLSWWDTPYLEELIAADVLD